MGKLQDHWTRSKPLIAMISCQIMFAAVNIMFKLSKNNGFSPKVITAYRMIFATAFLVPLAYLFEWRQNSTLKLTWTVIVESFFCGLFGGTLAQNLYFESLALTSATFVTAMFNLVPGVAFLLAIPFGMERLGIRTVAGLVKVLGTVIGIGGAMVLTFYKGFQIPMPSNLDIVHNHAASPEAAHAAASHPALGALLALLCCFNVASWLIMQTRMSQTFPFPYTSTALMSFMGAIQCVVYAFCAEKEWKQWRLGWNIGLLTVIWGGVAVSGVMYCLISWCVRVRGPLYVAVFGPLSLILVAVASSILIEEKLYIGSVIGAVLIVFGLYCVLWGKGKEEKKKTAPSAPGNV